ncbi:hypothetical protein EDB85DRAFT_1895797 [Lactarius pseudohatsudake]|nr:hypothetical protein EDB85DRAFT_1895797 [Lactarius pseudohatsudake]
MVPSPSSPRPIAVASVVVVAALAGCWVTAGTHAAQSCVGEVESSSAMYKTGNHRAGVEKVASHRPRWLPTLNVQDYDNHKPPAFLSQTRRRRPVMAIPTTTTTQRATAATMTTHRRRFKMTARLDINGERRHDGKASSNDDDNATDGGSGAAITQQAAAVTQM